MNVLTKFRDKLKKKRDTNRVLGIDLFHVYFQYQVLLVSRNAVEYIKTYTRDIGRSLLTDWT